MKIIFLFLGLISSACGATIDDLHKEADASFKEWMALENSPDFKSGTDHRTWESVMDSFRFLGELSDVLMLEKHTLPHLQTENDKDLIKLNIYMFMNTIISEETNQKIVLQNLRLNVTTAAVLQACDNYIKFCDDLTDYSKKADAEIQAQNDADKAANPAAKNK